VQTKQQQEDKSREVLDHLTEMAGGQNIRGMRIAHNIRVLGRLFDMVVSHSPQFGDLSGSAPWHSAAALYGRRAWKP